MSGAQRVKVKRVKLEQLAKIRPKFSGAVATYNDKTDTILIDVDLPMTNNGTYHACLNHEMGHRYLHKQGLKLKPRQAEAFCDWFALASTQDRYLSSIEALAKKWVFWGLSWNRDRAKIIRLIILQLS